MLTTPATLRRIYATIHTALNAAIRERLIADNPARYLELPPAPRPHTVVWTQEALVVDLDRGIFARITPPHEGWGQNSFLIKRAKIANWRQHSSVGGATLRA